MVAVSTSLYILMGFIALIMIVEVLNGSMNHALNAYGLEPRTTAGLIGIPLSPFPSWQLPACPVPTPWRCWRWEPWR